MLFAIGLALGFYQLSHPAGLNLGPGNEMAMEARNLVEEGIYGNSFRSMKTGPTATNPPLYPLFLALCIYLFHAPVIIVTAILITNIVVNAFAAALLPGVSAALWGTTAPGIAGGALMIFASELIPSLGCKLYPTRVDFLLPPDDAFDRRSGVYSLAWNTCGLCARYPFPIESNGFTGRDAVDCLRSFEPADAVTGNAPIHPTFAPGRPAGKRTLAHTEFRIWGSS